MGSSRGVLCGATRWTSLGRTQCWLPTRRSIDWNTVGTHCWSAVDFYGLGGLARLPHLQGNRGIRNVDALNS